jgi:hypothetical protein
MEVDAGLRNECEKVEIDVTEHRQRTLGHKAFLNNSWSSHAILYNAYQEAVWRSQILGNAHCFRDVSRSICFVLAFIAANANSIFY